MWRRQISNGPRLPHEPATLAARPRLEEIIGRVASGHRALGAMPSHEMTLIARMSACVSRKATWSRFLSKNDSRSRVDSSSSIMPIPFNIFAIHVVWRPSQIQEIRACELAALESRKPVRNALQSRNISRTGTEQTE